MNVNLNFSPTDALRLQRILHALRMSLSLVEENMNWKNVGSPSAEFTLDDIIFIEDLRAQLAASIEEEEATTRFAGYCNIF